METLVQVKTNNNGLQEQVNDINRKLDVVLKHFEEQRARREEIDDLVDDLSRVGKDAFKNTVVALDQAGVEINSDELTDLGIKLIRNVGTFNDLISLLESGSDLVKDLSPVVQQIGLDGIQLMNRFEQKGYFEYLREAGNLLDNLTQTFTVEDLKELNQNLAMVTGIIKKVNDQKLLQGVDSMVNAINKTDMDDKAGTKSLFKLLWALNSREMRMALSYITRVTKEAVNQNSIKIQ